MARLCERPGCSDRAEVAYGFDATGQTVWLDSLTVELDARSGALCRRHADAMGVPRGWTLDDRREPVPRLFRSNVSPVGAPGPAASPAARRRVERGPVAEQLRFDTGEQSPVDARAQIDRVADAQAEDHGSTEPGPLAPWVPQFDQRDDLHGMLDATGPLLSRAFGGRARPDH